jgi:adenylyltransferase/sulfurtransferase
LRFAIAAPLSNGFFASFAGIALSHSRYIRQETFEPIGPDGQCHIAASAAVVVGCGALGTNIANNLARSGVGRLRIIDPDIVQLDNLQRQVLFDEGHVRRRLPKAIAAVERLGEINSAIRLEAEVAEVTPHNVESLLAGFDVVLDGTDNVETRLLLNDACLKARVPYVFGGAVGDTGMTMAVVADRTPCFRCLLGTLPEAGTAPTAATAGILNSTTAVVGALQCALALRLLTGTFQPTDQLLCIDVWDREFTPMTVPRVPDCPACGQRRFEFLP